MVISVIIPVYNGEKYIERCINSVIKQTYSDWEIIAVDDGSCDNSLNILKKYAEKDNRIKVLHQENKGAGEARNKGIECASGDYIVFLDVDDMLEPIYLFMLSKKSSDVVFIDVERVEQDTGKKIFERMSVLNKTSKDEILRCQITGKVLWGGVRKAVKRKLLSDNNIRYSVHKVGEEALYSFLILYYAKTISFIEINVYKYFVHKDSLSRSCMDDPWGNVAASLIKMLKNIGVYEIYANTLNAFLITAAIVSLDKMSDKYRLGDYLKRGHAVINNTKRLIDKNYAVDYKHMDIKAKMMSPFFSMNMPAFVFFIHKIRILLHK